MLKKILFAISILISSACMAQLQVSKLVGKNSKEFDLGYGGFLNFGYPVTEAADITIEVGVNIFQDKDYGDIGWAIVPVKLGYRYTLNKSGAGFYIMPQAGYNVYGIDPSDRKFTGLVLAGTFGYLFSTSSRFQPDVALLFESAFHKGGSANYISLRLTQNLVFGRRDRY